MHKAVKMILQFQNQTDLEEFIKCVEKQAFADTNKLTVIMSYDEAVVELATKAFNATLVNPPNERNNL